MSISYIIVDDCEIEYMDKVFTDAVMPSIQMNVENIKTIKKRDFRKNEYVDGVFIVFPYNKLKSIPKYINIVLEKYGATNIFIVVVYDQIICGDNRLVCDSFTPRIIKKLLENTINPRLIDTLEADGKLDLLQQIIRLLKLSRSRPPGIFICGMPVESLAWTSKNEIVQQIE